MSHRSLAVVVTLVVWTTVVGAVGSSVDAEGVERSGSAIAGCPHSLVPVDGLGLDFVHENGASGDKHLPETMGAGVAWFDHDGDGWWDLYLVQSGPFPPTGTEAAANRLFRNRGGDGFEDVTARSGAAETGYGQGVVAADVDGDGAIDLYVANFGTDALLRNRGDGTFEEVTAAAGLAVGDWSSSAAFGDTDRDGDLDLYVTRYLDYDVEDPPFCGDPETGARRYCDPNLFVGLEDSYLTNLGNGRFAARSEEAGIAPADGRGLGVVVSDLDGDRWPDIYVANDLTVNLLFRNRGDGRFENVSLLSGAGVNREGQPEAGMGIGVVDVDSDGRPDLAVTNFDVETNTLYVNSGDGFFTDRSAPSGFGLPSFNLLGFGIVSLDLHRDGDSDLFVGNGHIFEEPRRDNVTYRQPPLVLVGDGRGSFETASCDVLDRPLVARGVAAGDRDNDGDAEIAIQTNDGPVVLLDNTIDEGSWVGLRLTAATGNTEAVGAEIRLQTSAGTQRRWVTAGDSYQSSSDRRVLFGMPTDVEPERIEVLWPDGGITHLADPPRDRYLTLHPP